MRHLIAFAVALAAGIAVTCDCSHPPKNSHTAPMDSPSQQNRVPGEYLVTLTEGSDSKAISDLCGRFGIKSMKDIGKDIFLVILTDDPGPAKMEELGKLNTSIKAVQPNIVYRMNRRGNDP